MTETFRQYIKIRTFLGYRPKEILLELQNVFGNQAPTYANVQRWSKRFRDAVDSPLGSLLDSQSNFEIQENRYDIIHEDNDTKKINTNAKKSKSIHSTNGTNKSKQSSTTRFKPQQVINE